MASVTFPPSVGGDGSTVSDDSNPSTGLANGGHRTRFVPALAQIVNVGSTVVTQATNAAASAVLAQDWASKTVGPVSGSEYSAKYWAQSALSSAGTNATSTTSLAIGTGSKSLTLAQTGKAFVPGQYVQIVSLASGDNWMVGYITAFTSGTGAMTVFVTQTGGTGTIASWVITPATASYLPTQTGNSGAYLTTNGSVTSWVQPPAVASQAEMETGTEANLRQVSPLRVRQSVTSHYTNTILPTTGDRTFVVTQDNAVIPNLATSVPSGRSMVLLQPSGVAADVSSVTTSNGWTVGGLGFNTNLAGTGRVACAAYSSYSGTAHGVWNHASTTFMTPPQIASAGSAGGTPNYFTSALVGSTYVLAFNSGGGGGGNVRLVASNLTAFGSIVDTALGVNNASVSIIPIGTTQFIVAFADTSTSTAFFIGTLSGTTITLGTVATWNKAHEELIKLSDTLFVCRSTSGDVVALSVSGSTITVGSGVSIGGVNSSNAGRVAPLSATSFLVAYNASGGGTSTTRLFSSRVGTISGTTITLNTAVNTASNTSRETGMALLENIAANTFFCVYDDATSGVTGRVITVSGTTVSLGSTASQASTQHQSYTPRRYFVARTVAQNLWDASTGNYFFVTSQGSNPVRALNVTGTTVTAPTGSFNTGGGNAGLVRTFDGAVILCNGTTNQKLQVSGGVLSSVYSVTSGSQVTCFGNETLCDRYVNYGGTYYIWRLFGAAAQTGLILPLTVDRWIFVTAFNVMTLNGPIN